MKKTENDNMRLFFAFLKRNNAYTKFIYNLKNEGYYPKHIRRYFEIQMKKDKYPIAISNAFCWRETKEGDRYWRNLSKEWKYVLRLIKLN